MTKNTSVHIRRGYDPSDISKGDDLLRSRRGSFYCHEDKPSRDAL